MTPEDLAAAIMETHRRTGLHGLSVDFLVAVGPEIHIIHQGKTFTFTITEEH